MIYTIIDKNTGQELRAQFDKDVAENEVAVTELRTDFMENPYFNFLTREFYDKI